VLVVRSVAVVSRRRLLAEVLLDEEELATTMPVVLFEAVVEGDNNKIPVSAFSLFALSYLEATW
jgi:hypothetical protein